MALLYGFNTNVVHRWRREARDTEQTLADFRYLKHEIEQRKSAILQLKMSENPILQANSNWLCGNMPHQFTALRQLH